MNRLDAPGEASIGETPVENEKKPGSNAVSAPQRLACRESLQALLAWMDSEPSDQKAARILRALVAESLKTVDRSEELRWFDDEALLAAVGAADEGASPREWIAWSKTAQPWWEARREQAAQWMRDRGIDVLPYPKREESRGGRGRRARVAIVEGALDAVADQADESHDTEVLRYQLAPAGSVKVAWVWRPWFSGGELRLRSARSWLLLGSVMLEALFFVGLLAIGLLALLFDAKRPLQAGDLAWLIVVAGGALMVWNTWRPFVQTSDDRVTSAPSSMLARGEDSAQIEVFREGDLRYLRLVRYTSTCPVCGAVVRLDDGAPERPRRMVGRCAESPREHVFSFDRVTRQGRRLRKD